METRLQRISHHATFKENAAALNGYAAEHRKGSHCTGFELGSNMIGPYGDKYPQIDPSAFVHSTAEIYGEVSVGAKAAILPFCVMRGDINKISIGESTNVQDNSVLHVSDDHPCILKDWVTVGHNAVLHGATVEKGALIGIGSVVLDGAIIGEEAWVGAGAVVTPNTKVPPRMIVVGNPAKIHRELKPEEIEQAYYRARRYIEQLGPWYKSLQVR